MAGNKKLLILPGDGIGRECMVEVKRVIDWMDKRRHVSFDIQEDDVGGAAYDRYGTPLHDNTMADAMGVDAVLLGAVGGPKWETLPFDMQPERGLLRLRKEMDLFANLRPAIVFDALAEASTLKLEVVQGLDIMIVRELTSGMYFGQPRGVEEDIEGGGRVGINTHRYTTNEIRRVVRIACELAEKRNNKVTSCEKANVMEAGVLWREEAEHVHKTEFPNVEFENMYADNAAMQLVRNPKQFDVIVTDNLFGDILSDEASMCTGSLGMLPSASLGEADESGRRRAMFEPVHGSAPDITGTGAANPLATLLSYAMCLRYSFDMDDDATLIEQAVKNILDSGLRTADIMQPGKTKVSTEAMGEALVNELDKLAA